MSADFLDHPVMIDQSFGYPAIEQPLRQVPYADFPST
jgi:hypothetical protein